MSNSINLNFKSNPKVFNNLKDHGRFIKKLKEISVLIDYEDISFEIIKYRRELKKTIPPEPEEILLKQYTFIFYILDLIEQGWEFKKENNTLEYNFDENNLEKEIIQQNLSTRRDDQLRLDSTLEFIKNLEKNRLFGERWHSIYSLMRDGRELKNKLLPLLNINNENKLHLSLKKIIKPYIQFINNDEERCNITGLKLMHIWRYFRHTWTVPYKQVPGRSMLILIRDAGVENHPVIGLGGLCSATAQFEARDKYIGWHKQEMLPYKNPDTGKETYGYIKTNPQKYIKWINQSLETFISDIYKKDLFKDKIINHIDLKYPTEKLIVELKELSEKYIQQHRKFKYQKPDDYYKDTENDNWIYEAETNLFKSKRLLQLSKLLNIKITFKKYEVTENNCDNLIRALEVSDFRNKLETLIRMVKGVHVGIGIMDINVCGAIAPYNELLGGKLVAMLLTSPEIINEYFNRYKEQPSIIASSMQGKKVIKKPKLYALGTQSLYHKLNQYTRTSIPPEVVGDKVSFRCFYDLKEKRYKKEKSSVRYKHLGTSIGYGSFQFSNFTGDMMRALLEKKEQGRIVNFRFGEGANPNFRQHREAITEVGLDPDRVLEHKNKRQCYLVSFVNNLNDILLGIEENPEYIISLENDKEKTRLISDYWLKRWLIPRLENISMEKIEKHNLVYPIEHGAQVKIPKDPEDIQPELW